MTFDIRDLPIDNSSKDLFSTEKYAKAISSFILQNDSPLTISIQGEWGSGKTSIMKMIKNELCVPKGNEKHKYEAIWLNSWQYYINNDSKRASQEMILEIIRIITSIHNEKKDKNESVNIDLLKQNCINYLSNITDATLDIVGVSNDARENIKKTFSNENTSIRRLKKTIDQTIKSMIKTNKNIADNGFIFFIDDLDRISPIDAIHILEIFKNLFEIDNCVFVLAVDYEVIRSGLKIKYGLKNDENQRFYKAYFDKLIQLPFNIPTREYKFDKMIKISTTKIDYFKTQEFSKRIYKILSMTLYIFIKNNPRSYKRILNYLSLSKIIDELDDNVLVNIEIKVLNFIFVAIQIGHIDLYNHILTKKMPFSTAIASGDTIELTKIIDEFCEKYTLLKRKDLLSLFEYLLNNYTITQKDFLDVLFLSSKTNTNGGDFTDSTPLFEGVSYEENSEIQLSQGEKLINNTLLMDNDLVLDVGCGNGKTTLQLFFKNPTIKIDAFDFSESQIEVAQSKISGNMLAEKNVNFFTQDATDINEFEKYDLIFSNAALHWVLDHERTYRNIFRALKPGGRIAIHQGGKDSYKELHDIARETIEDLGYDKYFEDFKNWKFPIYYPTKEDMDKKLKDLGFNNISVKYEKKIINEVKLVKAFANASLLPYLEKCRLPKEREILKKEFIKNGIGKECQSNRLYIFAEKLSMRKE